MLLKRIKETQTKSGIYIPDEVHKSDKLSTAEVILKADDVTDLSVGDIVLFNNYSGSEFKINEDDVILVPVKSFVYAVL